MTEPRSPDSAASSSKESSPHPRDSRVTSTSSEWELIPDIPSPLEEHKHLIPPTPSDQPKLLCGYLRKETTHSFIKTWKTRWVVIDDDRHCLYYYNLKTDAVPQGSIDLSNSSFSYAVENMSKFQFEIITPQYTYSFQAASQEAMLQWLESLKKKRRLFSQRIKSEDKPDTSIARGLIANRDVAQDEQTSGVVIDSDQPPVSFTSTSLPPESHLQKIFKRIPRPSVRKSSAAASYKNESDRKSNFFLNVTEEEENLSDTSASNSLTDLSKSETERGGGVVGSSGSWLLSKKPEWMKKLNRNDQCDVTQCPKCEEYQIALESLEHNFSLKEQEVKDRDEMLDFLRKEIRLLQLKDKVRKELREEEVEDNSTKVDVVTQRDQLITSLQKTMESMRIENDKLEDNLRSKKEECVKLKEEINLYKETISAKDHVVMELTNKMFSLEKGGQVPNDPQEAMLPTSTKMLEKEIMKLKEIVEAYKSQNMFLSQEIMELNEMRTSDANEVKYLKGQLQDLEAENVKVKSKYAILLKESRAPTRSGDETDIVSQMMQEAIEDESNTGKPRTNSETMYDIYGFKYEPRALEAEPDETLDSYVKRLDQRTQIDENTSSQTAKWDNFMSQFAAGRELVESDELKLLIRGGIPKKYKERVWKYCIRKTVASRYIPGFYQQIASEHAGQPSLALNQIELDLLRTLPSNKYYNSPNAPGIPKLRRVLVAYSWYDTSVGYCQGLNRLAAIALLFLEEEDAFWCLVAVVLHLLPPGYYNKTLLGSQTDQKVLRDFITEKMNILSAHLDTCDIDFSLITFNWFHTLFIDNLPIETTLRIWDTFLYEGSKVLFRYAMAIFKYNEESLLKQENSIQIFNKLRTMSQEAADVNKLTQIAFYDTMMRNFSKKKIHQKRTYYRSVIEAELSHVDALRSEYTRDKRHYDIDSDDDD